MAAVLNLVFNTDSNFTGTKTIIIRDPKDNLTKAAVKAVGEKVAASEVFNDGEPMTYKEAYYHENKTTDLAEA